MAMHPTESLKEQYKLLNYVAVAIAGLFVVLGVFGLYRAVSILIADAFYTDPILVLIAALPAIPVIVYAWSAKLMLDFDARGYVYMVYISLFWLVLNSRTGDIVSVALGVAVAAYSFYLKGKLFPGTNLWKY